MNYDFLMPMPKQIIKKGGVFNKPDSFLAFQEFSSDKIAKALSDMSIQETASQELSAFIISKTDIIPKEGYLLQVLNDKIHIEASCERGAFYAIKTLKQLWRNSKSLEQVEISDSPDLPMRAVHITLGSGNMPTFERLKEMIPLFADYKLNTFIIEYDDRFPWEKHPKLVHKDALSKIEIMELIKIASDNFIEIIPLLDSLGHAQQYLIHEEYAHLKELSDNTEEMCASNPDTLKFMKELWEEVLDLHSDSRFAHITGDETFRMGGFCPECKKYANEGRLAELFVDYYKNLSDWIILQGKTPIIWGDMLIKYPEKIDEFSRDIWINDWAYFGIDEDSWDFYMDKKNPEGKSSKERDEIFNPYWMQDGDEKLTPYPFYKFFKDKGFNTLAATAISAEAGPAYPLASSRSRFANNKRFAESAVKNNGEGLTVTFWSSAGMIEGAWLGLLSAADFSWHSRVEEYEKFAQRFSLSFLDKSASFSKELIDLDKKVFREKRGFLSLEKTIDNCTEFMTKVPEDNTNSFSGKYLDILVSVNKLNDFDRQTEELTQQLGQMFIGAGDDIVIDLKNIANTSLNDSISPNAPLFSIESGEKYIYDGKFKIDADALLKIDTTSQTVKELSIDKLCDSLLFITMCHSAAPGETVAVMQLKYEDDSLIDFSFVAAENTADWWGEQNCSAALVAWEGESEMRDPINAYLSKWQNPAPNKKITSVSFVSKSQNSAMLILGISARQNSSTTFLNAACIKEKVDSLYERLNKIEVNLWRVYKEIMSIGDMETAIEKLLSQRIQKLKNINSLYKHATFYKENKHSKILVEV